jgi:hypothetical protein
MLELTHGKLWAGTGTAQRLIVMFSHGGVITWRNRAGEYDDQGGTYRQWDLWAPKDTGGALGALGDEMAPLQELVGDLILLRGVDNMAGCAAPYGGDHRWSNVTAMTCADVVEAPDPVFYLPLGPSLDQVLGSRLAEDAPTPFPTIDLNIPGHQYGTPFYRAANEATSSECNPNVAFATLFAGVSPSSEPDPELVRIRAEKKSVLDGVLGGFARFRERVGTADRLILDAHADHIRSLEKQLEALDTLAACTIPDVSGTPDIDEYGSPSGAQELTGPVMVDILVHALRCGLSHVATLQIADIIMPWLPNPFLTDLGHSLHHAARDIGPNGPDASRAQDWLDTIVPNRNWRMGLFARLVQALKDAPEGAGTMLDNSVVMFTSEFSTGADHSVRDVPMLLAGRAGGRWTTGRHLYYNKLAASNPSTSAYETDVSTHNVFTSILNAFGYDDAHFGNDMAYKTGPLAELG